MYAKKHTKQMNIAKDNLKFIEQAGFMMEEFGENTIKISGVPEVCINLEAKDLIEDMLNEINTVARTDRLAKENKLLRTIARKSAKNEKIVSKVEEIDSLMGQLLEFKDPFIGADGDGIAIKISKNDIEKKFARK